MEPRLCPIQKFEQSLAVPINIRTSTRIVNYIRFCLKEKGNVSHRSYGVQRSCYKMWLSEEEAMLLELMHLHISSLHQGSATHGPPERRITSDWHCLALPYLWQRTSSLPFTFCLFFTSPQPLSSSQLAGQPPLCRFSDCLACCSKRLPTPALHKGEN